MSGSLRLSDFADRLSLNEFWDLLGHLEHQQLEFKESARDLTSVIPAMAMSDGGLIVLGVTDQRQVVGCELTQRVHDRINKAAADCHMNVQHRVLTIGAKKVTVVAVPAEPDRIVTTPDGRLLRRVGSENRPLVGEQLARFVRERSIRSAEEVPIPAPDLADLDRSLLNKALEADRRSQVRRATTMQGLIALGLAEPAAPPADPAVRNAAVLLFARDPSKYVPGAFVQLVRRSGVGPGPTPVRARQEIRAPIPSIVEQVMSFVWEQTQRYEAVVGTHRERISEYPDAVIREAVLNAIAHRDYGLSGATVDVTLWDDRLEIHSPGSLPGHITLENMRKEHYARNRRVMQVLKLLGLVEDYGEGVDRMFSEMEARLMEPPVFTATEASVTVTVRNRFLVDIEDQVWLSLLGHAQLTPSERRTLVLARREEAVTPRRLREVLPQVDAEALLGGAVAKGLLVRVGERGGSRYVLSDEVLMRAGASGVEAQSRKRQRLLDEILLRGSLSTAEGAELLGEDRSTVRDLLNDLVRSGAAVPRGRTRARRYYPR